MNRPENHMILGPVLLRHAHRHYLRRCAVSYLNASRCHGCDAAPAKGIFAMIGFSPSQTASRKARHLLSVV